jgi:WD40 repeat protein
VAFSPDGSRYAYAARQGREVVVILNGKEIFRAPHSVAVAVVALLSFTPGGKLLFYAHTGETMGSYRLVMDGKPVTPSFSGTPWPFFSADGAHWGMLASKPMKPGDIFLIIDGKEAGYTCQRPQLTPDGKHVVCTEGGQGKQSLLVDGKPIMTVFSIDKFTFSLSGDIAAIASVTAGKKRLYINGKPVAGGEDAWGVTFSPDGKHWATTCVSSPAFWVVVDGKKQQEYTTVHDVAFTPDSSKCVYIAETGVKKFVVVNGEEDEGSTNIPTPPMFGKTGKHLAYCGVQGWQVTSVHHDDKVVAKNRQVSELTLSPDGARYAYHNALDALSGQLIVDGGVKGGSTGGGTAYNDKIFFSPDSHHIAAMSSSPPKGERAVYLDGRFVPLPKGLQYVKLLGFTQDSQHLLIRGAELAKGGSYYLDRYFLDGKYVAQFVAAGISSGLAGGNYELLAMLSEFWEAQPDGSIVLIGHEPDEDKQRGAVKRVKVTPDPGTSIATWAAETTAPVEAKVATSNPRPMENPTPNQSNFTGPGNRAEAATPTAPTQPPVSGGAPVPLAAVAPQVDACSGKPRCYSAGPFVAEVIGMTPSQTPGSIGNHVLQVNVRFRNLTNQPLILAYVARSGVITDNNGKRYDEQRQGFTNAAKGIGTVDRDKADPQFVLSSGASSNASFVLARLHGDNAPRDAIGTAFNFDLSIAQLEVLPGQQIHTVREYAVTFSNLTATGGRAGNVLNQILQSLQKK